MAFLIDREIMRSIERDFPVQMEQTASHKIRAKNDIQYEMMYYYYIMESPKGYSYELKPDDVDVDYYGLRNGIMSCLVYDFLMKRSLVPRLQKNHKVLDKFLHRLET